ncbi:Uncharacterised protein [Mycobacteroides abscessus]|nr:Uncharacterised protein [Mycobacteroides abscessus]
MPDVWVSRCRIVTSRGIVVPARSTWSWTRSSSPSRPSPTSWSTATAVNSLVTDATSNRVLVRTGTPQRRDATP